MDPPDAHPGAGKLGPIHSRPVAGGQEIEDVQAPQAGAGVRDGAATLRVLAQTAYPLSAPSPRVRIASFVPFLRPHGVTLDVHPTMTDAEYAVISSRASALRKSCVLTAALSRSLLHRRPEHDLLLVQRLRLLTPVPGLDPPRRVDVYDLDDALFIGSPSAVNRRFQWIKQDTRRCGAYLRRAKLVIAGNSFLAAEANRHARRVEIVPSCVDPARQDLHVHEERDVVVVGWIGSRTTSAYLPTVLPAMERLNRGRLRAKLVLVGADPALKAPWIEHRPWSLAAENGHLASFDIGIMPLPDTEWARGKCGYKVLQYFAAGVPAVASPVGVAPELIGQDRGLLAASSEDWQAALEQLIADVEERRQRGAAARQFVERYYSYQRWAPELASLLRSVPA
ncbi:MAG TPA: glycosyltransferase family 4 protein [Solirubrobacteraceae bacterium]